MRGASWILRIFQNYEFLLPSVIKKQLYRQSINECMTKLSTVIQTYHCANKAGCKKKLNQNATPKTKLGIILFYFKDKVTVLFYIHNDSLQY